MGKVFGMLLPVIGVITLALILDTPALAQTSGRSEEFVYATTHFDGTGYGSALVPPQAETIYLIANVQNILAPRRTQLYYWPITNRYLADWDAENQIVQGQLEITQNNKIVSSQELVDYVVQSDSAESEQANAIYMGEAAHVAYAHYQELQKKYRDDLYAYYQAQEIYRKQVDEIVKQTVQTGKTVSEEAFPKPPEPVAPLSLFSREIAQGYLVSLPIGSYTIQLRLPDGNIQANSQKKLIVFDKLAEGVGYTIVPQTRWTKPETSSQSESVIYTAPGATIYIQPFHQSQYNSIDYTRMSDAQDESGRENEKIWVAFAPYKDASLRISAADGIVRDESLEAYFVQQLPGSGLGYEVVKFDPSKEMQLSFEGYEVELNTIQADYNLQLVDVNGNIVPASHRQIRVLNTDRVWFLYMMSALPLVLGFGTFLTRRKRVRKIKVDE